MGGHWLVGGVSFGESAGVCVCVCVCAVRCAIRAVRCCFARAKAALPEGGKQSTTTATTQTTLHPMKMKETIPSGGTGEKKNNGGARIEIVD